jgi:hypothetical protein
MRNLDAEGRPQASARRHLNEILRTKRPECREKKGRRDQHNMQGKKGRRDQRARSKRARRRDQSARIQKDEKNGVHREQNDEEIKRTRRRRKKDEATRVQTNGRGDPESKETKRGDHAESKEQGNKGMIRPQGGKKEQGEQIRVHGNKRTRRPVVQGDK